MKKMIVLLLALTLLTSFVAPAMASPPWEGPCECPDSLGPNPTCFTPHEQRGHPLCVMPNDPGVRGPNGPPFAPFGLPPNAGADCLRKCITGTH